MFIITRNDAVMFRSDIENGGYDDATIRAMTDAGYKIEYDGRPWNRQRPPRKVKVTGDGGDVQQIGLEGF